MPKKRYFYKGTRVSKGEKKIAEYLTRNEINFSREYSFPDLISAKNCRLRFDFFIPDFELLIEFQGQHHFNPVNKHKRAKIVHRKTVLHDKLKEEYCSKNKIRLLRIPYSKFDEIESILDLITNAIKKSLAAPP